MVFDLASGNKQVEHFQSEKTFDLAGAVCAKSGVDVIESVAVENEVGLTGTGARKVLHFPWNTRIITGGLLEIEHAAIVTIREFFAKVVDPADRFTMSSSVIVLEVTPATVLVDSIEVIVGEDVGDGSWLRSVGFDQRSNVPVGQVLHLILHRLETGMGIADEKGGRENFHLLVAGSIFGPN